MLQKFKYIRLNLIGVKNNVGKTSLLEAIELLSASKNIQNLMYQIRTMLVRRQRSNRNQHYIELDVMYDDLEYLAIKSNIRQCTIKIDEGSDILQKNVLPDDMDNASYGQSLNISVDDDRRVIQTDRFLSGHFPISIRRDFENNNINYIQSSKIDEHQISLLYGALIDLNKLEGLTLQTLKNKLHELSINIEKKGIDKVGILLDADKEGIDKKIELINEALQSENIGSLISIKIMNKWYKYPVLDVSLSCHILNISGQGKLETMLKAIKSKESIHADCLTAWKDCLE